MNTKPIFTDLDRRRLGRLLISDEARAEIPWHVRDELEWQLEESAAALPNSISDDVVTMNSTVRLHCVDSPRTVDCTVVYPEDVELVEGGVSVLGPLGSQLIGLEVGDIVDGNGEMDVNSWEIIDISYQPEREGAFHL